LQNGGQDSFHLLYLYVTVPDYINPVFLGISFFDLSQRNIALAVVTGVVQFWQAKMLVAKKQPKVEGAKDEGMMATMNKQMLYFMPIMTVLIGASLPSGLVLYWLVVTLLTGLQQMFMFQRHKKEEAAPQSPAQPPAAKPVPPAAP
jgi:YidC/Oxa1 family membrane protein insertase